MFKSSVSDDVEVFGKDLGLIHELVITGRKIGVDRAFYASLAHDQNLFVKVAQLTKDYLTIDCDAKPFPQYKFLTIEKHIGYGKLIWDASKIKLYILRSHSEGNNLDLAVEKEIEEKPILNATVMCWLLQHPDLIPAEWKGKSVVFWGTIFLEEDGRRYVMCLYWNNIIESWQYKFLHLGQSITVYRLVAPYIDS